MSAANYIHCVSQISPWSFLQFSIFSLRVSVNDIDQTANTYNLNACNKVLIKTSKAKLKQLRLTLLKHLLILIIVNRVIIFRMVQKYFSNKLRFVMGSLLYNFFGIHLPMIFCKLHHFIIVTIIFLSCEKIQLSKKIE